MKKGFTLIELLAVIVILAVVLLISTPIVLNIIENAKKNIFESSIKNIEKAAKIYYHEKKLNDVFTKTIFICDGEKCTSEGENLKVNGRIPESAIIEIESNGEVVIKGALIERYGCEKVDNGYNCANMTK